MRAAGCRSAVQRTYGAGGHAVVRAAAVCAGGRAVRLVLGVEWWRAQAHEREHERETDARARGTAVVMSAGVGLALPDHCAHALVTACRARIAPHASPWARSGHRRHRGQPAAS